MHPMQVVLNRIKYNARFGKCDVYDGDVTVCESIVTPLLDRIYIPSNYDNVSFILNDKIETFHDLVATHKKYCIEQVLRVMCRYYLPPCGNFSHPLPPSSICKEECSLVQSKCYDTWTTAAAVLHPLPFIDCDDTSRLLIPLPNCCTGAGITTSTGDKATSSVVPTPTLIGT